tara:strand:+ start:78 stop:737 length:660 start_codon:yes stop_codon:yes gene_type:complete
MFISVLTGIAAGSIHVFGGADHLLAMSPVAMKSPRIALKEGIVWGIGHSMGVLLLSSIALWLKDFSDIQQMSFFAELTVGFVLVLIGLAAIKRALGLDIHKHEHKHGDGSSHDHIHLHFRGTQKHLRHSHAVAGLGILHGLAGAGHLLAVIPALALPPLDAIAYLAAYLVGSVFAMTSFVMALSFATSRMKRKALPLFLGSTGVLSVLTGIFWINKIAT